MVCQGKLVTFQVLHQEKSVVGAKVSYLAFYRSLWGRIRSLIIQDVANPDPAF